MDELISEWDRRRYIPKPGEPDLPPQLSDMAEKTSEDIMKELNRLPFFMTELDETDGDGGENTNLEALKSLAYDGEPDEIATNFKNQDDKNVKACYRSGKAFLAVSRFEEAKAILEYGLAIDPENKPMKDTLDQTIKKQKQINDAIERKERED
ncbi:hypothetical protein QCA50_020476 [Cerrena zonata]|uniref:Uncharacterized protein n=1 Tax=Cerrena zonata TaxID=2478898 RepID=A0AAW0FAC1_9APHY